MNPGPKHDLSDLPTHERNACPHSNLFLVTNATDIAWATRMADGVRESILAEAARVEEGGADKDEGVTNGMATLSVMVRCESGVRTPL